MNTLILQEFKEKYPEYKVIYLTISGSKLYGTDTPSSDTDYKGLFIPPLDDILLKQDIEHFTTTTGTERTKNGTDDVDVQLWSIYKFIHLLEKGETGALDLLFSMQQANPLVTTEASRHIWEVHKKLLHKQVHSFIGYCIGQSKKYNIKGERYGELLNIITSLVHNPAMRYTDIINASGYKYIKMVRAPGSRGNKGNTNIPYISVLGKLFDISLPRKYILKKLVAMEKQYGARSKSATDTVDYKALSHAVRVLLEVKELLQYGTITFPLPDRHYIKSIKAGNEDLESILNLISENIEVVEALMESSTLQDKPNERFNSNVLLSLLVK